MSDEEDEHKGMQPRAIINDFSSDVRRKITEFQSEKAVGVLLSAPKMIRRELQEMSVFGMLTRFPAATVLICLFITVFLAFHSGITDQWTGERSMNVNGDLAAFLPLGSPVAENIAEVEKDWTTNVMIIYVESGEENITQQEILSQLDELEQTLNWQNSDEGVDDNIIYVLSISSVVKEINSSAPRVADSFVKNAGDACPLEGFCTWAADNTSDAIKEYGDIVGGYSIPEDQQRINQIIGELPDNARDKLVRDVGRTENGTLRDTEVGYWNRAVIIIGVAENDADGDGVPDISTSDLIEQTQAEINRLGIANNWGIMNDNNGKCEPEDQPEPDPLCLRMTLTGPVPITNAVTEYTFSLFWKIFPIGCIAVAGILFLFHCDVLQTGRVQWIQGIKVVIIAGLPTLCSVFATLGIIGWQDFEVTMTVIITGPIILALGVSYGLHITNRYAESKGTPKEKMALAIQSTGRAVFLSAVTTVIGFVSLILTPMAPIQTVGYSLAGGIIVVYIFTMVMVPNLTMLLDLQKPSHPPPKIFVAAVRAPIRWNKIALSLFIVLMLFSGLVSRENVVEDVNLLDMAPQEEPAVKMMMTYSDEFESGQVGMIMVEADIAAEPELLASGDGELQKDPYDSLVKIEELANMSNEVEQTTAVSIAFLMKSIGASLNASGADFSQWCDLIPDDNVIFEVCQILFATEYNANATFWLVLEALDDGGRGGVETQSFLISVFYDGLTPELRHFFVSKDFQRSLIYIDMPFMPVKQTEAAAGEINDASDLMKDHGFRPSPLIGVAAVTIDVNNLIVGSQWQSIGFALLFTVITLGFVFRDARYAVLTTFPVIFTVAMQWLVMDQFSVTLSLVTVMIGSILVGVGVDFSIHIANRVRELGGDLEAIQDACASTGMSLFEAMVVTSAGMMTAFLIPIPALKPFVVVIIVLLLFAAISALLLLPAIYATFVKEGWGLAGGSDAMRRKAGLAGGARAVSARIDAAESYDAVLLGSADDAW
ncbi:MAG TPA: MMPL family transporter [Candidatus Thalassarchaeaceae archaeon]|nr:MMPL family transporter [Candidatus Thalassarchaeaceae archaeon]HJM67457.1 MMPL family transporter [Candidatus Thalassarchaeaceae archaeon]